MQISEFELQQSLQRFASGFSGRVIEAMERMEQLQQRRIRDEAIRRVLVYVSSAYEIATGPSAAINLLDMFVFVRLSRAVLERHWKHELGADSVELGEAFARADARITQLVHHALGDDALTRLTRIVDGWLRDNPEVTRVEGLRLADFAESAGATMAARSREVRGLISSVKSASKTAGDALQIVERVLFLAHRLPFLWRMQARLGVREVVSDTTQHILDLVRAPSRRLRHAVRQGAAHASRMLRAKGFRTSRLRA